MPKQSGELRTFGWVLLAATIIGGFVGGELADRAFSITGAVVGGVGTATVLLSLGAYFDAQERRRRDAALPPEMRAVFDRMLNMPAPKSPVPPGPRASSSQPRVPPKPTLPPAIAAAILDLAAQDAAAAARGETPSRRLIPHHAIKRDVALAAYEKDLKHALGQIDGLDWTATEKAVRRKEIEKDFAKYPSGIRQMGPEDLDKLIALMKRTRTDLKEIEASVRAANPIYSIVEPL